MRTCKGCGREFDAKGRRIYCSHACRQRVYEKLRRLQPVMERCLHCQQPIGIRLGGRRRQFCSDACRMAGWRNRHQVVSITCDQCGKVVRRSPTSISHAAKNHFCSPVCKGKWMSENLVGSRALNWKGDSPEFINRFIVSRLHSHPRWKAWAAEVFANAKGLCERCGNPAQEAHHKREVAELLALILDPANGEALCQDCHVAHHHS